jgi:hypothetical protein
MSKNKNVHTPDVTGLSSKDISAYITDLESLRKSVLLNERTNAVKQFYTNVREKIMPSKETRDFSNISLEEA